MPKSRVAGRAPLTDASARALAETFKVLGDTTRVRILDALSRSELCVQDLAGRVGISEAAVSHQLRVLAGMRAWLEHEEPLTTSDSAARRRMLLVWTSGVALAAGIALQFMHAPQLLARGVLAVAVVAGAALTIRKAIAAIRMGLLDINVL